MEMHEGFNPYKDNPAERQIITFRTFEEVLFRLGIDPEQIKPGMKVLSVGEGLSNFARTLKKKTGADVVACDAGYALFTPYDTPEVVRKKIEEANLPHVVADRLFESDIDNILSPPAKEDEEHTFVAASVYSLPFEDNSFHKVVSTQLLEHVRFDLALPELLRVLKENGEIWFGGEKYPLIFRDGTVEIVLPTDKEPWYRGWPKAFLQLKELTELEALSCYGVANVDLKHHGKEVPLSEKPVANQLLSFVIKKGDGIPDFQLPATPVPIVHYGDIVKLDIPSAIISDHGKSACNGRVVDNIFVS